MAELAGRGIEADAVELPLTSFADDTATAREAIGAAGEGAVVCGHSYGGQVISAAAAGQPGVVHLVYLCAFQEVVGEDIYTLAASDPPPLTTALVFDERGMTVDPARVHEVFYADSDPAVAAAIAPKLRAMPIGDSWVLTEPPAWETTPSTYVVCTNDKAIPPFLQRTMAARATETIEWENDHSPFLNRPGDVADLLASYLTA